MYNLVHQEMIGPSRILLFLLCVTIVGVASAQEHGESHATSGHEVEVGPNLIRIMAGYSLVPDIQNSASTLIPALGFDYQRFLGGSFYVGTYNDLELTNYIIRTSEGQLLEREFAFVTTIVAGYDFSPSFSAFVGPGYEFETNKNFFVLRAGVEFMKEITHDWTVSIPLYYDYKVEYGAIGFGLAVAKKW